MSQTGSAIRGGTPLQSNASSPYLEHAETRQRLERANAQRSKTQQELDNAIRVRSTTPNMSSREINAKDQEIAELRQYFRTMTAQVEQLQQQLLQSQTTIKQQQATIRTQSKQISNPNSSLGLNTTPSHRGREDVQYGSALQRISHQPHFDSHQPYSQPQEVQLVASHHNHNSIASLQQLPYAEQYGQSSRGEPEPRPSPFHRVNDFGSPAPLHPDHPRTPTLHSGGRRLVTSFTPGPTSRAINNDVFGPSPPHTDRRNITRQPPLFQPSYQDNSGVQSLQPYGTAQYLAGQPRPSQSLETPVPTPVYGSIAQAPHTLDPAILEGLNNVFRMAKDYAWNHVNFPNTTGDTALSQDLKNRILKAANPQTAFPLLRSSDTRYWIVTKVILQWLLKHIMKQSAFQGFDQDFDNAIGSIKSSIYESTPDQVRFYMLSNMATEIRRLPTLPGFEEWQYQMTKQKATQLYWIVRPMAHQPTIGDMSDLENLIDAAFRTAHMMFSGVDEYSFNFPDIGARFCRFAMNNIDPKYGNYTDDNLRARHASVRLAATPEISVRLNQAQDKTTIRLERARVLLKVPGDY